jgi:hypothetical protein
MAAEAVNHGMTLGDVLAWSAYGILGILIVWLIFVFKRRMDEQDSAQRMADAAFEAQVLQMARAAEAAATGSPFQAPRADLSQYQATKIFTGSRPTRFARPP